MVSKKTQNKTPAAVELRRRAELQLAQQQVQPYVEPDALRLLHELQVHQIELEMQNEALRQSQSETLEALGRVTESNQCLESVVATRTAELILTHLRIEDAARLHRAILENMADGVHLVRTRDARIVFANPTIERMFGYAEGELLGKHVSCLNYPGLMSPVAITEEINLALGLDGFWRGELCNVRKDGIRFWCRVSVSAFTHAEFGQVWVYVHTDVSEKVELERERALREANLAVWEWELSSGLVVLNQDGFSFLGYDFSEITFDSEGLRKLVHPEDAETALKAFEHHMQDRLPSYEAEFRLRHKLGHWVWVLDRGRVIERNAEGQALRMAGTLIDIGRHKQFQFAGSEFLKRVESLAQALTQARGTTRDERSNTQPPPPPLALAPEAQNAADLSARQREVLSLVSVGLSSAKISERLNISTATVNAHRRDIMRKLDLHSAAALTRYALESDASIR
jgi:PAS domain S-box-containing protein